MPRPLHYYRFSGSRRTNTCHIPVIQSRRSKRRFDRAFREALIWVNYPKYMPKFGQKHLCDQRSSSTRSSVIVQMHCQTLIKGCGRSSLTHGILYRCYLLTMPSSPAGVVCSCHNHFSTRRGHLRRNPRDTPLRRGS
jgi:hypothetical protein